MIWNGLQILNDINDLQMIFMLIILNKYIWKIMNDKSILYFNFFNFSIFQFLSKIYLNS